VSERPCATLDRARHRWSHLSLFQGLRSWLGLAIVISSVGAAEFDETMVRIALVLVNLSAIVTPTIVVWRLADSKDDLRRKCMLQSWQFRQLVS